MLYKFFTLKIFSTRGELILFLLFENFSEFRTDALLVLKVQIMFTVLFRLKIGTTLRPLDKIFFIGSNIFIDNYTNNKMVKNCYQNIFEKSH